MVIFSVLFAVILLYPDNFYFLHINSHKWMMHNSLISRKIKSWFKMLLNLWFAIYFCMLLNGQLAEILFTAAYSSRMS